MIMGVKQLQNLFKLAAGLHIDKSDAKRTSDFINVKLRDLLILGQTNASANGRDIIELHDIPLTNGFRKAMQEFSEMDERLSVSEILEQQAKLPPLKMALSAELEEKLPELAGAITVSLAKVFKVVNPEVKNPGGEEWEQVEQIYEILL